MTKIIVPTFIEICMTVLLSCITFNFAIRIIGNVILSSMLNPYLFIMSTESFIDNEMMTGKIMICYWIVVKIVGILYAAIVMEPQQYAFCARMSIKVGRILKSLLSQMDFVNIRKFNNADWEEKYGNAQVRMTNFIVNTMYVVMNLMSFFGYISWIIWFSPLTMVSYIAILTMLYKYYPNRPVKNNEEKYKCYDKLWYYKLNLYNHRIHFSDEKMMNNEDCIMTQIDNIRTKDRYNDKMFSSAIIIACNIAFVFNCFFLNQDFDNKSIIIYIQYCMFLHDTVESVFNVCNQYKDTNREYKLLSDVIENIDVKDNISIITEYDGFGITKLTYSYKKEQEKGFSLVINCPLYFERGQIILLCGDSGHGKSTFADIISGMISHSKYTGNYHIYNGKIVAISGLDALSSTRVYNEQKCSLFMQMSIAQLITGNLETLTYIEKEILWQVIDMCSCTDFVSENDDGGSKKWIHATKITLSGGQEGRVMLARTMFRVIQNKPLLVIFDEIDKAVQAEEMVKIMKNIYRYVKQKKIITFVIAHSTEIKVMNAYDQTLIFVDGQVSKK